MRTIVVILGLTSLLYAADPVLNLIDQSKKAYQQENYRRAHDLLQEAISKINEKLSASYKPFLPDAPNGWTGREADSESFSVSTPDGNIRVTEAQRKYVRDTDQRTVRVTITNTPEILKPYQKMAKAMQAPMMKEMMNQQGIVSTENKDGWYIVFEKRENSDYEMTAVHEKVVIKMTGADSEDVCRKFLDNINLDNLVKASN